MKHYGSMETLKKFDHSFYRDLKPSSTQNPLTNFFEKKYIFRKDSRTYKEKMN